MTPFSATATTSTTLWRIVYTDSWGTTTTLFDSNGNVVPPANALGAIGYTNYGPPAEEPPAFKSLYQRRLERSLEAIAERVRERVRYPRRVVTRPRQTEIFARRTCSVASRWMVLQ